MAKRLVIVESPAKAKTINRYLGQNFWVKASLGHVRDLPKKKLGVEIQNDFKAEYSIIPERRNTISELQSFAEKADSVLLAADPDREGEAICWHLASLLESSNKNIYRVLMNEITKKAVTEAFQNPGALDYNKINAQQTRRILDRLVGYLISPLLWKKIGKGLSAGRVQSIALRLICEREREIRDFEPEEFWSITAHLEAHNPPSFKASLVRIDGRKAKVKEEKEATHIVDELWKIPFVLKSVERKEKKKAPPPPYITSTLQQEAFRLLRFSVKKTMSVAQRLYEGLEIGERGLVGLITYMRTDSVRVSNDALYESRAFIKKNYTGEYLHKTPRIYKNKRMSQDAHEAIRPTSLDLPPQGVKPFLTDEEHRLYTLIWNRFIATQMSAARTEETEFEIEASHYLFLARAEDLRFDGYLVLYPQTKKEEKELPLAEPGERLKLLDIESKQNFTQPPPRFTEGTLVKELEAKGIGRPSTYAPIISTLQSRVYVVKEKGKFIPTDLGLFITDYMIENFPDLMEFEFTARLETELDLISEGEKNWLEYLKSYYALLDKDIIEAGKKESIRSTGIPLEDVCPQCGRQLVIKDGRYGKFRACSGYPECKFKESLVKKESKSLEEACPECGSPLVLRRGKYGLFIACSNYPKCRYIKREKRDTGIACPRKCGGTIVRRKTKKGRLFHGCSNFPKCRFATWDEPIPQPCPECGQSFVLRKNVIRGKPTLHCSNEECSYKEIVEPEMIWEKN